MRKLALLGNGGGGKSTAARRLSEVLGIEHFAVDSVQWLPGWERQDPSVVERWHRDVLEKPAWVLDGWGSWNLIDTRIAAADVVVVIDLPLDDHLAGARTRSLLSLQGEAPDAPPGCVLHEVDALMEQTLRYVDAELMPLLRARVASAGGLVFTDRASLQAWIDDVCKGYV